MNLVQSGLAGELAEPARQPKDAKSGETRRAERRTADEDSRPRTARKRRFPYRKVEDLEAEILKHETRLEELHAALALPETHRDGDRVRQVKAELAEVQAALETLCAHWEEAVELNW